MPGGRARRAQRAHPVGKPHWAGRARGQGLRARLRGSVVGNRCHSKASNRRRRRNAHFRRLRVKSAVGRLGVRSLTGASKASGSSNTGCRGSTKVSPSSRRPVRSRAVQIAAGTRCRVTTITILSRLGLRKGSVTKRVRGAKKWAGRRQETGGDLPLKCR